MQNLTQTMERLAADIMAVRKDNIDLATSIAAVQDSNHTYGTSLLDMTQQLQSTLLLSNTQIHELKESQDWGSTVQGILPLEVTTSIQKVLEGSPYSRFLTGQTMGLRPLKPRFPDVQRQCPTIVSPKGRNRGSHAASDSAHASLHTYPRHNSSAKSCVTKKRFRKMKRGIYNKKYRNLLGSIAINAYLSQEETPNGPRQSLDEFIEVDVNMFFNPLLWSRCIQAHISYDRTHGFSSPLNIQLELPNIHPSSDAIVDLVLRDDLEGIKGCFTTGKYRPNDLYLDGRNDYQSLLTVRTKISTYQWRVRDWMFGKRILAG